MNLGVSNSKTDSFLKFWRERERGREREDNDESNLCLSSIVVVLAEENMESTHTYS